MPKLQVVSLVCALLVAGAGHAAPQVLHTYAQESIPPKWLYKDGKTQGLCPDILAAIEKREPTLRFAGMNDVRSVPVIENGLESGAASVACALLDTMRRRQIAHMVPKPLYVVRHRLAAAAGDTIVINNLDDLARQRPLVNTSRGAAYSDQLRKLGVPVDDTTGDNLVNLRKILAGHGRLTYINELTLGWIVQSEGLAGKVRVLPVVLKEEPVYFWISRKVSPGQQALIEKALDALHAEGELARIYERWSSIK